MLANPGLHDLRLEPALLYGSADAAGGGIDLKRGRQHGRVTCDRVPKRTRPACC